MRTYMARLGGFQFGIDTAAFQELQRTSGFKWQAKARIGRQPAQQNTGREAETISLSGVIYPHYRGGLGQIEVLRQQAAAGEPLPLIYSSEVVGQYLGLWCVTSVEETRTVFFDNGMPRKIDFSLKLVEYGEDADASGLIQLAAIASASTVANVGAAGAASQAASIVSQVQGLTSQAGALSALGGIASAAQGVAATVSSGIGAVLNSDAVRLATGAVRELNNLKAQAAAMSGAVRSVAGIVDNPAAALGALGNLATSAGTLSETLGSAARKLGLTATNFNGAGAGSLYQRQIASAQATMGSLAAATGSLKSAATTLRGFF